MRGQIITFTVFLIRYVSRGSSHEFLGYSLLTLIQSHLSLFPSFFLFCVFFLFIGLESVGERFAKNIGLLRISLASESFIFPLADVVFIQLLDDEFLRLMILRFIFCFYTMHLHRAFKVWQTDPRLRRVFRLVCNS